MKAPEARDLTRSTLAVLFLGMLIGAAFWVLRPFVGPAIWATMVVVATWPVMRRVQAALWGRRSLAVVAMTLVLLLLFVVPLLLAIGTIVGNADQIVDVAQQAAAYQIPGAPPPWLVALPVIVIGGKIFGWFTATESAAIAVLYSLALSLVFYRELGRKELYHALLDTGKLAATALFCVGTASAFGWLLAYYQIPKALLATVTSWHLGLTGTGFFIAFVFLVVGCFLDAIPAIIIVGTILAPLTNAVGMHPIHFALIGIVALAFGLVTPPYGLCLLISCSIAKVRLLDVMKDVMIMLIPMLLVLVLIIVAPELFLAPTRWFAPDLIK